MATKSPMEPDRHTLLRIRHIREARQALLLLAVMQVAGGVFLYFDMRRGDDLERLVALSVQGFLTAVMVGYWAWSRSQPRAALLAALATWCALLMATAVLSPRTALYGGVVAIIVTWALGRGARAAVLEARVSSSH